MIGLRNPLISPGMSVRLELAFPLVGAIFPERPPWRSDLPVVQEGQAVTRLQSRDALQEPGAWTTDNGRTSIQWENIGWGVNK